MPQFRKVNTDYAAFTLRGTSDWDDRSGGTAINGESHVWSMRKSEVRKLAGGWKSRVPSLGYGVIEPALDDDLKIGARDQDGITAHASVEIGEILIFNSALSDQQVFMVQGYLSHKWGMQDKMPESHPYGETGPIFENRPEINIADPHTLLLDQNVSFVLETNRPATNFSASGLPSGLSLDSSTGEVSGFSICTRYLLLKFGGHKLRGPPSRQVFEVKDFSQWPFSLKIGSRMTVVAHPLLVISPLFLELNDSTSRFSYEQFVSSHGYDLRFLTHAINRKKFHMK